MDLFTKLSTSYDLSNVFFECFPFPEVWRFREVNTACRDAIPNRIERLEMKSVWLPLEFPRVTHLTLRSIVTTHTMTINYRALKSISLQSCSIPTLVIEGKLEALDIQDSSILHIRCPWKQVKSFATDSLAMLQMFCDSSPMNELRTLSVSNMHAVYWNQILANAFKLQKCVLKNPRMAFIRIPASVTDLEVCDATFPNIQLLFDRMELLESLKLKFETSYRIVSRLKNLMFLETLIVTLYDDMDFFTSIHKMPLLKELSVINRTNEECFLILNSYPQLVSVDAANVNILVQRHAHLRSLVCSNFNTVHVNDCQALEEIRLTSSDKQQHVILVTLPSLIRLELMVEEDGVECLKVPWSQIQTLCMPVKLGLADHLFSFAQCQKYLQEASALRKTQLDVKEYDGKWNAQVATLFRLFLQHRHFDSATIFVGTRYYRFDHPVTADLIASRFR